MATRIVEWKKPYTWGQAIDIDENKVISLKLRDENNLIIYDEWDDEIYVDLQLPDWLEPTDAFPVWVNTGRVIVADGWDKTWTIVIAKTTSGDYIEFLYADDWTLWIDNATWTFKQIYLKGDVDTLITNLTTYINTELAKKQNGVVSGTAPSNPSQWDLWYDTTNNVLKVYDGSTWVSTGSGWGDVQVSTQANNIFTPWMKIWWGTQSDYQNLTPDSNTAYLLLADQPTPPSPWRQPWVNTILYAPFSSDKNDHSWNSTTISYWGSSNLVIVWGITALYLDGSWAKAYTWTLNRLNWDYTMQCWINYQSGSRENVWIIYKGSPNSQNWWWTWNHNGLLRSSIFGVGYSSTGAVSFSWWHLLTCAYDSNTTTLTVYYDGNQEYTYSMNYAIDNVASIGNWHSQDMGSSQIYYSEWIIEDKCWSASEISDYYDLTKWNYWIS